MVGTHMNQIAHDAEFEMRWTTISINYKSQEASNWRRERLEITLNSFEITKQKNEHQHQHCLTDGQRSVSCALSTKANFETNSTLGTVEVTGFVFNVALQDLMNSQKQFRAAAHDGGNQSTHTYTQINISVHASHTSNSAHTMYPRNMLSYSTGTKWITRKIKKNGT